MPRSSTANTTALSRVPRSTGRFSIWARSLPMSEGGRATAGARTDDESDPRSGYRYIRQVPHSGEYGRTPYPIGANREPETPLGREQKEVHMFGTRIANRTARGMAVGALILSLGATTFAGSANAAPLGDETQDCSAAAHARNDAVHLLHTAWKAFSGDLKDLARDARQLQHEAHKASAVLTVDARDAVASAKQELKGISTKAHEDIQAVVDLGTACKD